MTIKVPKSVRNAYTWDYVGLISTEKKITDPGSKIVIVLDMPI